MCFGILLVRCTKPRLLEKAIFASPNFHILRSSHSRPVRKPTQQRQLKKRPSNVPQKREIPSGFTRAQSEPIAYIPSHNDYPELKKWMFTQPWDYEGWNRATKLAYISRSTSCGNQRGQELWKFSFHWRSKGGKSFTVSSSGKSKSFARKDAANRLLATLHEMGVLNDLSREMIEAREKKIAAQIEEKETMSLASKMRADVYNYGASILAIPQVQITAKKTSSRRSLMPTGYIVNMKLEERNISIEENGASLVKVESNAYSKFRKLIEEIHENESVPNTSPDDGPSLDVSQGKEFVFYYKRKSSKANIKSDSNDQLIISVKREQIGPLVSAQVCIDGEMIGAPVFSCKSKEAEELSYLTAAIDLAKKNPLILKMFFSEQRSSSGEIIQPYIQVPLKINRTILEQISDAASPINNFRFNQQTNQDDYTNSDSRRPRRPFRSGLSFEEERSRNEFLKAQYEAYNLNPHFQQLRELKASLPMNQYRQEVLSLVTKNNFCVIVGETGSGKTTQVPGIIFEDAIVRGKGASINIMCTQPRRIAAKSVASRVAFERGEKLQDSVGYHVYLDVKRPRYGGSICYCTTEILLKQLQNNPDEAMNSISHIIVDEAHERDIPIDFLLITLKKIIQARRAIKKPAPKIIIMSATLNISLFANYFGEIMADGTTFPCPFLTVPGKTFPVRRVYLNELLTELNQHYGKKTGLEYCSLTQKYLEVERCIDGDSSSKTTPIKTDQRITWRAKDTDEALVPHNLAAVAVAHIVKSSTEGAILVFLPGLKDLEDVQKSLLRKPLNVDFSDINKHKIILLHSLMKDAQNTLFEPSSLGCRKIILATNIAETSITIPDVRHVIDSGKLNEMNFDPVTRIKNLKCTWVSKSNSRQRSGRAGRVQNGFYYALFSEGRFNSFRDCGLPQLLRSDLKDVCLSAKGQTLQYSIQEFLADAIEKPSPQAVDAAIKDLVQLGALTRDEEITPLGRLLHSLPVDPDLGKMVVLGVIFRCLDPLLILAAAESEKDFFMRPISARKEADQARYSFGRNTFSDAITTIKAFRHARYARRTMSRHEYMGVMIQKFLNANTVETIEKKMFQIEEVLVSSGVIPRALQDPSSSSFYCGHYMLNENSDNHSLVKALTLARCPGNLAVRIGTSLRFRTKTESGIQIRTGINGTRFREKRYLPKTALMSFASIYKDDTSNLCLRDTNLINPIAATLFGGALESRFRKLVTDDWIIHSVNSEREDFIGNPYNYILRLRTALNKILSKSFLDLAKRQNLLDDKMRREFTSSIAQILSNSDDFLRIEGQSRSTEDTNDSNTRIVPPNSLSNSQSLQRNKNIQPLVQDLLTEIEYRKIRSNGPRQKIY